jgi:hypothetical protein
MVNLNKNVDEAGEWVTDSSNTGDFFVMLTIFVIIVVSLVVLAFVM